MTQNQVMKLWTVIVTAFVALCAALGFVTTAATTAVAQTEPTGNTKSNGNPDRTAHHMTMPTPSHGIWSHTRALPPTMKQRIRAEAHGKTPSCRQRPLDETDAAAENELSEMSEPAELSEPVTGACGAAAPSAELATAALQR